MCVPVEAAVLHGALSNVESKAKKDIVKKSKVSPLPLVLPGSWVGHSGRKARLGNAVTLWTQSLPKVYPVLPWPPDGGETAHTLSAPDWPNTSGFIPAVE